MYPPAAEVQVVAVATPAQRTAKAAKMVGYLSKTQEKIDALVYMGPQHKVDPARIEIVSSASLFWLEVLTKSKTGYETSPQRGQPRHCIPQNQDFHFKARTARLGTFILCSFL
jgi:hypothetical protein